MLKSKIKSSFLSIPFILALLFVSTEAFSASETSSNIAAGETRNFYFSHNAGSDASFEDTIAFSFAPEVTAANITLVEYDFFNTGLDAITASLYDSNVTTQFGSTENVNSYTTNPAPAINIGSADIGNIFKLIIEGDVALGGAYGVQISAVPLPASAWLFISGLLAMGGWSIVKRKREAEKAFSSGVLAV